jgi:hypothetical protein
MGMNTDGCKITASADVLIWIMRYEGLYYAALPLAPPVMCRVGMAVSNHDLIRLPQHDLPSTGSIMLLYLP